MTVAGRFCSPRGVRSAALVNAAHLELGRCIEPEEMRPPDVNAVKGSETGRAGLGAILGIGQLPCSARLCIKFC